MENNVNRGDLSAYVSGVLGEIRPAGDGKIVLSKTGLYMVLELLQFYILYAPQTTPPERDGGKGGDK